MDILSLIRRKNPMCLFPDFSVAESEEDPEPSEKEPPPLLRWAALSLSGSRKERNDDSYILFSASPQNTQMLTAIGEMALANDDLFFGVSDGMGGGNAGNVASSLLLDELSRVIPNTFLTAATGLRPDYGEYLVDTVKYVHQGLNMCAAAGSGLDGMSATLTLAWFTPDNIYMVNVGDSRLYLCRNGVTAQVSSDHTFAWKQWKRGEINEFQYRKHPRRSALYEVMGGGHQMISPYVSALPYKKGDRFLLCTDGLVDGLWERHIGEYLAEEWEAPSVLVQKLGEHAMMSDSHDDKTLIVVDVC